MVTGRPQILLQLPDMSPHQVQRLGAVGLNQQGAAGVCHVQPQADMAQLLRVEGKIKACFGGWNSRLDLLGNMADRVDLRGLRRGRCKVVRRGRGVGPTLDRMDPW